MINNNGIKNIILYSTMTCPYCIMEHEWLKSKKVTHEVVHVDQNPKEAEAMITKTGQMGVPVTEIQYEDRAPQYIIGFDQSQLAYYLGVN